MLPISRILVPVDFSERCLGIMPYVKNIADKYNAEVTLLHVVNVAYSVPGAGISAPAVVPVPQWVFEEKGRQLETFAVSELQGVSVHRVLDEGDPEIQISVEAQEAQLVIMPTHGYGPFRRFLIGSVTAKVLHDVSCPVLTGVHLEDRVPETSGNVKNVVCAVEFAGNDASTLSYASNLAEDFGAALHIVHVIPPLNLAWPGILTADLTQDFLASARRKLEALKTSANAERASTSIREGDVVHEVCAFARSAGADLLVVGRGSVDDNEAGTLNPHAYAIIREASCPVLSV